MVSAISIMIVSYQLVLNHHHPNAALAAAGHQPLGSVLEQFRSSSKHRRDQQQQQQQQLLQAASDPSSNSNSRRRSLPLALQSVLDRARHYQSHCQHVVTQEQEWAQEDNQHPKKAAVNVSRLTSVDLPAFGIVQALESYAQADEHDSDKDKYEYTCQLPPETECQETQVTVIFMGYNPDRLQMMKHQIHSMLHFSDWQALVYEVVLVWNGPRQIQESSVGKTLLNYQTTHPTKFRIFYPLLEGFPNDLMNRYHPRFRIQTKAILFYDDDGPFYSYSAVLGGFELWKRNANAEIGAMARKIDITPRQELEKKGILNGIGDRFFVSHCGNGAGGSDTVVYNYHFFAQFGANMALPSGSFFHSNYLCWIWHPALAELRQFVKDHPVHPDDATVSMIISQLAGRAPKVYSRRINTDKSNGAAAAVAAVSPQTDAGEDFKQQQQQRKRRTSRRMLQEQTDSSDQWNTTLVAEEWNDQVDDPDIWESRRMSMLQHGRKLLWEQQDWGKMRREAVNSLVSYFGSLNSGSIGWCYGTQWQVKGGEECLPDQAKPGMLPWMQPDHTPKTTCP